MSAPISYAIGKLEDELKARGLPTKGATEMAVATILMFLEDVRDEGGFPVAIIDRLIDEASVT